MAVVFRPPPLRAYSKIPCRSSSLSSRRPPAASFFSSSSAAATATATTSVGSKQRQRKLPVLLFDVMDTLVRDPFYHHIPGFFQMSLEELLEAKHPTAWAEFEMGLIDENELAKKFFKDGRFFDLEGLKECMIRAYSFVDGIEELLQNLKQNDYEMHAFTNYPIWYMMIEEKLKLSKYLSWTFCSCKLGKRKPDEELYMEVLHQLAVEPQSCIFIDDSEANVEAAAKADIIGLHFRDAESLKQDLSSLGVEIQVGSLKKS